MHTLLSTSVTKEAEGDLVPLSAKVVEWVYGNAEYVGSVFGTTTPTRRQLREYYETAEATWHRIHFNDLYGVRDAVHKWLRSTGIRGLDYFYPIGKRCIWFKYQEDSFAFCLKFGIIDNKSNI